MAKTKKINKAKYNAQWARTGRNKLKARARHELQHPNDKEALRNWAKSPVVQSSK